MCEKLGFEVIEVASVAGRKRKSNGEEMVGKKVRARVKNRGRAKNGGRDEEDEEEEGVGGVGEVGIEDEEEYM